MNISKNKIYENSGNEEVIKLIEEDSLLILDIGCGAGSLAKKLFEKGKFVDGISISSEELQLADPFLRKGYLYNLENGLPPEIKFDCYDCVICSHVIEHIAYPERLLNDIKNVLKENGFLIIALPNLFHYKSRIQLMKGNFFYTEAGIWDYTHLRWFSFRSAYKMLSEYFIFEVATVTGELPFNRFFRIIFPEKFSKLLYSYLIKMSKGLFGYQLLFKLKNKKSS
jgi:2-polyprenyl-3-methyl-5-hydroxy-6-metoxy-1,4-benzoquinol methylase